MNEVYIGLILSWIELGRADVPVRIRRDIVQIQRADAINEVIVAIAEPNGHRRTERTPPYSRSFIP